MSKNISAATIKKIREELSERKEQILKELKDIEGKDHKVKFPEYGDKLDENAQEIDDYTRDLATDKIMEESLRDIENTLKRIKDGSYGTCKYCKNPIEEKRLLARPVASACVDCKRKLQSAA